MKEDLEGNKKKVDAMMDTLKSAEEEERKEIENIKATVESKKGQIIDLLLGNIIEVDLSLPEVLKKRMVKKTAKKK